MSEELDRLKAMIEPRQQTWDLSPNDLRAIRWAVERIKASRTPGPATAKMLDKLLDYRQAPDFAGCISVTLWMTGPEAAAFIAEHEPPKDDVE